jgi:iron(III) transport system substrate-binding protein
MRRVPTLRLIPALIVLAAGTVALVPRSALGAEVVIYSARKEELIRPALDAFQKETGIRVTLLSGKAGDLARRIELERNDPKGDLFLGTTAGIAELLRRKGLLAPYFSPAAQEIPEEFRAPDGAWVGITGRVRVLIYNKHLVTARDLPASYFDLTDPRWKGKVAVASMAERTTVSWLAALMVLRGEEAVRQYVRGLHDNGLKVLNNNTEVRKAVARGEYAIGITNHYYYLLQLQDDPASPVGILYPDQEPEGIGTPVFSITAAIIKGAKHPEATRALVDFLLGAKGNRLLVQGEFEIPLLPRVPVPGEEQGVKALGQFKKARVSQIQLADVEPKVEKLFGPLLIP